MAKIGVIGAGSWGTALAILLHTNGHDVIAWSKNEAEVARIQTTHHYESKLPGIMIPEEISFTTDLQAVMSEKDVLVLAVPSPGVRGICKKMKPYVSAGQIVVNVSKGIEEQSLFTLTDIMEEELPEIKVAVLSGPSHAEEVSRGLPTTCVVSAHEKETADYLQEIFNSPVFRVYTSPDLLGVELGGALKNVIALAAGMADGLGYGDNTKAALITRGIHEIAKLGMAMGGDAETFYGLTGMGDLIVTCASVHSRNRKAGYLMGQGYSMEEAMKEVKMVVEGVYSARAAFRLSEKYQIEMPIVQKINEILFENKNAADAVNELMQREPKSELKWEK